MKISWEDILMWCVGGFLALLALFTLYIMGDLLFSEKIHLVAREWRCSQSHMVFTGKVWVTVCDNWKRI